MGVYNRKQEMGNLSNEWQKVAVAPNPQFL